MRNIIFTFSILPVLLLLFCARTSASELNGSAYTINSTLPPTTTNFQNFTSAIAYLTGVGSRTDGGTANTFPFGVSGPVTFNVTSTSLSYTEQIVIPAIPGASTTNTVTFNGNYNTLQFACNSSSPYVIRLQGAKYVTINTLNIKTTANNSGWGVHFYQNADSNTISNCDIDLTTISNNSAGTSCVGICFTASTTSVGDPGENGRGNIIRNNTIRGRTSTGRSNYGIHMIPAFSDTVYSGNKILNNTITNMNIASIYALNTNGTLIKGNKISNPNRTATDANFVGIEMSSGRNDTIWGNDISNPFGGVPTSVSTFYGIRIGWVGKARSILIANNLIYNVLSSGTIYGIYNTSSARTGVVKVYHNTISLDHEASAVTSLYKTYGFFHNSSIALDSVEFINNIISEKRGGGSIKYGIFLNSDISYKRIRSNVYYITGTAANIGGLVGTDAPTLTAWKGINTSDVDSNSLVANPFFSGTTLPQLLVPQNGLIDNMGETLITVVDSDFVSTPRTVNPDPGAYSFAAAAANDAGILNLNLPAVIVAGTPVPINVQLANFSNLLLDSVRIEWSVNGIVQPTYFRIGALPAKGISGNITIGSYSFSNGVAHTIRIWTSFPNGNTDVLAVNDSLISPPVYCTLNGSYTLNNNAPLSATNFTSFGLLADALKNGGVAGPVIINVTATSGPYTEQVTIETIKNASVLNNVLIRGNGCTLQFSANTTNRHVLKLWGSKHLTIDSLVVKPLNASFGWGIHLYQNVDTCTIRKCLIDVSLVTSATSGNSAGIAVSFSTTSQTQSGASCSGNTFSNNIIRGALPLNTGGPVFGITLCTSNTSIPSYNKIIGNDIQNFNSYGIYLSNTSGTLVKSNKIKSSKGGSGIYVFDQSQSDSIIGNIISCPFTVANNFTGIEVRSTQAQVGKELIIANNLVYDVSAGGSVSGISVQDVSNCKVYHNTISFSDASSASTTANNTYGFYATGTPSGNGLEFRNNIVSCRRGGLSNQFAIYVNNAGTLFNVNNNVYDYSGTNANLGYFSATSFSDLDAWKLTNGGIFDAGSVNINPVFIKGNESLIPKEGFINNMGSNLLAAINTDITGAPRTTTPDPGAFEFNGPAFADAGLSKLIMPSSLKAGISTPVNVRVRNSGDITIDSVQINWMVNGVLQAPFKWISSLPARTQSVNIAIGNTILSSGAENRIIAWTSKPNGAVDSASFNDSAYAFNLYCVLDSGSYTINQNAPASSTNFPSILAFTKTLANGGISGPVNIDIVTGSGPYNETVVFPPTKGASPVNKIRINGNGNTIQFNCSPNSRTLVRMEGAKYVTLNNLILKTLSNGYGWGVHFYKNADSNIISNCTIDLSLVTASSDDAATGICFTNSLTGLLSDGANGKGNTILNNTIKGYPTSGGMAIGISINPSTSTTIPTGNRIINNTIENFYKTGIQLYNTNGTFVKGNILRNPTKTTTSSTLTGISFAGNNRYDSVLSNTITTPFGGTEVTSTAVFQGISVTGPGNPVGAENIVANNIIYNIRSIGIQYGIYGSSASNTRFYHNTISLDDILSPVITTTNNTFGFYHTGSTSGNGVDFRNNIVNVSRGGTGVKFCIYLNNTGTFILNNNGYFNYSLSVISPLGYYSGTSYVTFSDWKSANSGAFDQNSRYADPHFRSAPATEPGTDSLDNIGANLLTVVNEDINGKVRTANPDPGANEFYMPYTDAGLTRFTSATGAFTGTAFSSFPVDVMVKNFGKSTIAFGTLNWSVNNTLQPSASITNAILRTDSANIPLGFYTIPATGIYHLKAWTSLPNGQADSLVINDTISGFVCTPLSGSYTLNPSLPLTGTNFTSFDRLKNALVTCGINGPVTIEIAPGIYTGSLVFDEAISGTSISNTITFKGHAPSDTKLVNGSVDPFVINLKGASHFIFRDMTIESVNNLPTKSNVILLNKGTKNNAFPDSNSFINCTVQMPLLVSGGQQNACIEVNTADFISIDSCSISGGVYGIQLDASADTTKGYNAMVSNNTVSSPYEQGIYLRAQRGATISKNIIDAVGNHLNTSQAIGIQVSATYSGGVRIEKNEIRDFTTGLGLYLNDNRSDAINRIFVANNSINGGSLSSQTSYGIYLSQITDNGTTTFTEIIHNSVKIKADNSNLNSAVMYIQDQSPVPTNNRLVLLNNVFSGPNGALAIKWLIRSSVNTPDVLEDYNCYSSFSATPFAVYDAANSSTVYADNIATFVAALNVPADAHSIIGNPQFVSDANLRSNSFELENAGILYPSVLDDIDGNPRNIYTPDIGVSEFTLVRPNDAGVLAILEPSSPYLAGPKNVKVVIKNFGTNTITSLSVSYKVDSVIHNRLWTGSLLPGVTDTILFTATSGTGSTSQQANLPAGSSLVKAWTSLPNALSDTIVLNDTASVSLCSGLTSGTYTINAIGSGANNFISVNDALNALKCGITGNVIFNIEPGTYTVNNVISTVPGSDSLHTVTFQSATHNASDVLFTNSISTITTNYVLRLQGIEGFRFEYITFSNTSSNFGHLIEFSSNAQLNRSSRDVSFKRCVFNGQLIGAPDAAFNLVTNLKNAQTHNILMLKDSFNYGSTAISFDGSSLTDQYSKGISVDSNAFSQNYSGVSVTYCFSPKITNNIIESNSPATSTQAIAVGYIQGELEIRHNKISLVNGPATAIYIGVVNDINDPALSNITNNAIIINKAANTTGIYISRSKRINVDFNTVRLINSLNNSAALNLDMNVFTPLNYDSTLMLRNNILVTNDGYALDEHYYFNGNMIAEAKNNVFYSALNVSVINPVLDNNFSKRMQDNYLLYSPVFTSTASCIPATNDTISWLLNGRGIQVAGVSTDQAGNFRPDNIPSGVPDIGAYEFTPTVPPAICRTAQDTIVSGATQVFVSPFNTYPYRPDTVAVITWMGSPLTASTLAVRQYTGDKNPLINAAPNFMYFYTVIESAHDYINHTISIYYKDSWKGTMDIAENNIRPVKYDTAGGWSTIGGSVDTFRNIMNGTAITIPYTMTGTDLTNPLPVNLLRLSANQVKEGVMVKWSTASESNTDRFEVERSFDGKTFKYIGAVNASGQSASVKNYGFMDNQTKDATVIYYRLRVVNNDRKEEYSNTVMIRIGRNSTTQNLIVYPNPFTREVFVSLEAKSQTQTSLSLTDIAGRTVWTKKADLKEGRNLIELDMDPLLKSGVYFLMMETNGDRTYQKIIKQ